jgi:fimbrial chaperone protein
MVIDRRGALIAASVAAVFADVSGDGKGQAQEVTQGLTVIPVTIEMLTGQRTAALTLENHTDKEADFQVRPYAWDQRGGVDELTPTDGLLVSPPLGRMAAGDGQVVRLVLRRPAAAQEASYRILLDQIPPPPEPGRISFALRLSIPVFAEAAARTAPRVRWSLQPDAGAIYLVAVNDGGRHERVLDLKLTGADGQPLALESSLSPYILAGATRRWRILNGSFAPSREALRLTAHADSGAIDQAIAAPSVAP